MGSVSHSYNPHERKYLFGTIFSLMPLSVQYRNPPWSTGINKHNFSPPMPILPGIAFLLPVSLAEIKSRFGCVGDACTMSRAAPMS